MKIGYQGLVGCNSYRVIKKYYNDYLISNFLTFEDLFIALENGHIDCFVLPVINNTTGDIKENLELFNKYNKFKAIKEIPMEINHCLYGLIDSSLDSIKKIISHKEALKQCSKFVSNYETEEIWNTAAGVNIIIENKDNNIACIAPADIENPNVKVLAENISNIRNNKTYFFLVATTK